MERVPLRIGESFQPLFDIVAKGFVPGGGDGATRFAIFDVEEHASIVAAFAPNSGLGPVHLYLCEWRNLCRHFVHSQEALACEPFVDGKSPIETLRAVIGGHQDHGFVAEHFEHRADLFIKPEVIVGDDGFVGIARLVMNVVRVKGVPETVVHAVETDVHIVKIVPFLFGQQPAYDFPVLAAHLENLLTETAFVISAEAWHIHSVLAHQRTDFAANFRRISEVALRGVRRKETADANALDGAKRVTWGQAHHDGALAAAGEVIPYGRLCNRAGIHEAKAPIRAVGAIAKTIDTERAR